MSETGIRFLEPPQPNGRVVAVEMKGQMTAEDMRAIIEQLRVVVDQGEKVLLYVDMRGYGGWDLGVLTEKLKSARTLWNAIGRYAIVGETRWVEVSVKILDPLTPQEIKHFKPDEVDGAWRWLTATETSGVA